MSIHLIHSHGNIMLKKFAHKAIRKGKGPLSDYKYSIDVVNADIISGWAKNEKLPNHNPVIDCYVDGILTWQAKCDQFRQDLATKGIGNFAFNIKPAPSALQSDCEEVQLYLDGHPLETTYNLNMSKNSSNVMDAVKELTKNDIKCYVNSVTSGSIVGWAKNKNDDSERLTIKLQSEGVVYAQGIANEYRADLEKNKIGDACYSFNLPIDISLFEQETVYADLLVNDIIYFDKKFKIEADPKDIEKAKFLKKFAPEVAYIEEHVTMELDSLKRILLESPDSGKNIQSALNLALSSIAEINVRMRILESAMLKYLK